VDFIQPDAPRVGGITSFLKIMALADHKKLQLAPHFCMEIHLHLTAAYGREPWVEHFEWSEAMFNETGLIRETRAYYAAPADQSVPICELIAFDYRGRGYHLSHDDSV
jgi:L-alanine-DL-glutamate epimerase-like enolase superfamily enzyme